MASEGLLAIPVESKTSGGVIAVNTHFYEFIPEEEHDSDNPTVLEACELEEGENYFILLTTSSGLHNLARHADQRVDERVEFHSQRIAFLRAASLFPAAGFRNPMPP